MIIKLKILFVIKYHFEINITMHMHIHFNAYAIDPKPVGQFSWICVNWVIYTVKNECALTKSIVRTLKVWLTPI
jgi:hypothetical protein